MISQSIASMFGKSKNLFHQDQVHKELENQLFRSDLLYLIENTFNGKRIYANSSSYPNPNSNTNPNLNPNSNSNSNPNPNPKAQLCLRTDEITSFFDQM